MPGIPSGPVVHMNNNLLLKALIYGIPGSGKTSLAATAAAHPKMGKVLFLSIDGGMLAVPSNANILSKEIRNNAQMTALEQVEAYFFWLANPDAPGGPEWVSRLTDVRTVVLDSVTELLTLELEAIVDAKVAVNPKRDRNAVYLEDYGKSTTALKRIIRYFKDLPMNVILTALAAPAYRGTEANREYIGIRPSLTEKLRESVMGYVDHVWLVYKDTDDKQQERFNLMTQSTGDVFTKTRGRAFRTALPPLIEDPDLAKIFQVLLKSETPASLRTASSATRKPEPVAAE